MPRSARPPIAADFPLLLPVLLAVLLASLLAGPAAAAVRPYLLGGGLTTQVEKDELDELLDPITYRDDTRNWELGGGLRLFSESSRNARDGERISVRLRFTIGAGDLPGERLTRMATDFSYRNRFLVTSIESLSYRTWGIGALFSARVLPRGGFYLGPIVQNVNYTAERAWEGPTECYLCGPAEDEATVNYGLIEAGAHYRPLAWPLRVEAFWIPGRVELSNVQKVKSENYQANFSAFRYSIGGRLSYEF